MSEGRLGVIRDGVELPEEQARALWRAFSEHMERNEDDLAGFARDHGFARVRSEHRRGRALLVIASTASLPPPPNDRRGATAGPRKASPRTESSARAANARRR
jgi:hypothetical protein